MRGRPGCRAVGIDALRLVEVEILGLLAEALGNREMARRLLVSQATVNSHLTHVYPKLGVDARA